MIDFKGKKVGILGLGVEGLSSAKFLVKKGVKVTVLDQRTEKELGREMTEIASPADRDRNDDSLKFVLGKDYLKNLKDYDILVRSPGIKRNLPEILDAEKNGVIITSQTKIFFDLCPGKIIGVTGTKGKGTTSSLIYEMLKNSFGSAQDKHGKYVYLGGNIGQSPFEFMDKLTPQSWVVLELSSFQLQDLDNSPHIAVVLMITSEHLDYHKDTKEYVDAKRNILRFQDASDFAVINRDYPASNESDIFTDGKVFFVSRERECEEGCFVKEGKVMINFGTADTIRDSVGNSNLLENSAGPVTSQPQNLPTVSLRKTGPHSGAPQLGATRKNNFENEQASIASETIIKTEEILLPGKHNWENVCAAVMAATLAGVPKQNIVSVLKTFKGLEHRLELVEEIDGVKFYDDSFSTTPETAIAAIEAFEQPEILILGGSSKNSDFTELGQVISNAKNIKAIIGIGEEWSKIRSKIRDQKSKIIEGCKNMREVAVSASLEAEPGDVVLLSPACASFGMFKNYKDRGEQFKQEVKELKIRNSNIEIRNKL